jgi:NAD+ synthase
LLPLRFVPGRKFKDLLVQIGKKYESLTQENLLAERFAPKAESLVAKGNAYATIKHRMRMVMLYHHANIHNLMVVGAANKTELLTGTFSQWGCDQCADLMPIVHLYRSQVEELAKYLGIPPRILTKTADPDVIPGLSDKEALLGGFKQADLILWGLENQISSDELCDRFGGEAVNRIMELFESSRFMREAPYHL